MKQPRIFRIVYGVGGFDIDMQQIFVVTGYIYTVLR